MPQQSEYDCNTTQQQLKSTCDTTGIIQEQMALISTHNTHEAKTCNDTPLLPLVHGFIRQPGHKCLEMILITKHDTVFGSSSEELNNSVI